MRKLEEFVNEKLKVTKNSGSSIITTTLRKFLAWFTGENEFSVNRFDLEDRKFISSDESMTKGDITDFLYKHINDTIYVKEEEKSYRIEVGLRGESKSKLYDYSFDIDGKSFSIDARIYNDNELLSNCKDYIIEKLKVSKNKPDTKFETTLNLFIREYFYIADGIALYSNNAFHSMKDGVDLNDKSDLFGMTIKKYFDSDFNNFQNWVYKLNKSKIQVSETVLDYYDEGFYPIKTKYEFDLDDKHLEFLAYFSDEDELISNILSENITEKLKVSTKSGESVRVELRDFVTWYMYDGPDWDESDLKSVEFARNTTESYFGGSYKKLYEFICKHEQDIVDIREYADTYGNYYIYEFTVEDIPFKVEAYIEKPSDLLSKQWRILVEKLKVTKDSVKGSIKSTMKGFFLWYWGYETIDFDFWDAMYTAEFNNDVIEDYFNDNINDFVDWFGKNMDDIVYFDEVKDGRENYIYTFSCDGIEFVIDAWVSPENNTYPFSKSQYIIRRLHEKLRVSSKRNIMTGKLKDVIFDFFNIDAWVPKYFREKFIDIRKKYFDDDVDEMVQYFCSNRNKIIEYEIETIEHFDETTELVELRFKLFDIEFSEQVIVEED